MTEFWKNHLWGGDLPLWSEVQATDGNCCGCVYPRHPYRRAWFTEHPRHLLT